MLDPMIYHFEAALMGKAMHLPSIVTIDTADFSCLVHAILDVVKGIRIG